MTADTCAWRAAVDAMFERMQTRSFETAVRKILDEPLRVDLSERLEAGAALDSTKERLRGAEKSQG